MMDDNHHYDDYDDQDDSRNLSSILYPLLVRKNLVKFIKFNLETIGNL